ncbi:MAG: PAS domain-containing sensor histidine kinase [Gammaproteobacteria bacterium]|nr:PAS domain-containing sensor histidine kinase [Gammaproteobacteria bacterium]
MTASELNAESLRSAFRSFNQHSSLLEASYRKLQDKVAALTEELRESQSARHRELLDKERLGARLRRILETVPGAIIVLDGEGIIRQRNSVAVDLLNRPLLRRSWSEIVQREFIIGTDSDTDLRLRDGRILSLARRSLQSEPGEILLLTDVTDSRQTAELLQRQQRLSTIGEMTARLAHQIRTPLASAVLYSSQLGSAENRRHRCIAEKLESRLAEMGRMVDDMLRFAAGARDFGQDVVVRDLLESVVDNVEPQLDDDCTLRVELPDESLTLSGNQDALRAALLNLVGNAMQACGAGAEIEIGAVRGDGQICLSVTDNGPGVPLHLQDAVFEPFYTTRPQGTGLGLAVVRTIAEAHGGMVLLRSDAAGSTFCLSLPAGETESPVALEMLGVAAAVPPMAEAANG